MEAEGYSVAPSRGKGLLAFAGMTAILALSLYLPFMGEGEARSLSEMPLFVGHGGPSFSLYTET